MGKWSKVLSEKVSEHAFMPVVCPSEYAEKVRAAQVTARSDASLPDGESWPEIVIKDYDLALPLDAGGIMMTGRCEYKFDVDELIVVCAAVDIHFFIDALGQCRREAATGLYPGMAHRFAVFAFTEAQLQSLVRQMRSVAAEASAVADLENQQFNERISGSPYLAVKERPVGKGIAKC